MFHTVEVKLYPGVLQGSVLGPLFFFNLLINDTLTCLTVDCLQNRYV